jgi:putative protein kinase ArgK-like GTPase of G3E family
MERERREWKARQLTTIQVDVRGMAEIIDLVQAADDAVLEARCEEDYWRERCRELERTVWEMVVDQDWQLS